MLQLSMEFGSKLNHILLGKTLLRTMDLHLIFTVSNKHWNITILQFPIIPDTAHIKSTEKV